MVSIKDVNPDSGLGRLQLKPDLDPVFYIVSVKF